MAVSIETILADARKLVIRLKEHDHSADCLISRMHSLQKQQDAMKQFQDHLTELNEVARHRPRLGLIIILAQENSKIRELQSENMELRQSLTDHQSALEVIMTKYREQLANLSRANQVERSLLQKSASQQQDVHQKAEKITEMTAMMWHAANMEEHSDSESVISALERENHAMRALLQLELLDSGADASLSAARRPASCDAAAQTQSCSADNDPFCVGDFATVRPRPSGSKVLPPSDTCPPESTENPQHSASPKYPEHSQSEFDGPPQLLADSADLSSSCSKTLDSTCDEVTESPATPRADAGHCASFSDELTNSSSQVGSEL